MKEHGENVYMGHSCSCSSKQEVDILWTLRWYCATHPDNALMANIRRVPQGNGLHLYEQI